MDDFFESLQRLRRQLPALLGQRAAAHLEHFRGAPLELRGAYRAYASVYHPDTGKVVDEAIERFGADEGLEALKGALALERIRAAALEEEEEGNHADRIERQREAVSALGGDDPWRFLTGLYGFDGAPWEGQVREALEATDDPWRELADWSLSRHVKEKLHLGNASEADLEALEDLAWLSGIFPGGALRLVALGTLDEMGFDVRRRGVRLDLEKRPQAQGGAKVFAQAIPSRVWVALSPTGLPSDWPRLFSALGQGFGLSSVSQVAPVEQVWTGEALLGRAFGALLGALVGSPLFLQKKLRATRSERAEAQRGLALASLAHVRRLCGQVLVEAEVWRRGTSPRTLDTIREIRERALLVRSGDSLEGIDPDLPALKEARALALAPILERALRERFDEDWWRNPRTGPYLAGLFAPGTRGSPEAIAALLGEGEPSLAGWTGRVIERL